MITTAIEKREIGNRRYENGDYVGAYRFYSDGLQCLALMDEEKQLTDGK